MVRKDDIPTGVAAVRSRVLSLVRVQFKYPVHWVNRNLRVAPKRATVRSKSSRKECALEIAETGSPPFGFDRSAR